MSEMPGEHKESDYLEVFLTRWLLSIISAMNGTYSLLVLVLCGGQRSGKTKFFRGLLPLELRPFYAESKLDKEKDDGIQMTQKLILMDDEFSGKSKKEAAKFKEVSSRDIFSVRKPYGKTFEDLKRYAVLCATTNEAEILNDPTGNRRLIPVNIKSIDQERYAAIDKTALFMELYRKWKEIGDGWMLTGDDVEFLNQATKENESVDIDTEFILKLYKPSTATEPKSKFVQVSDILMTIEAVFNHKTYPNRIGMLLNAAGFKKERKRINGIRAYGYWVYEYPRNAFTNPNNF
ncbi:VapE domain-containing protein [Maribacter dokdonensis]|nr:VapE domain-containing protein [Maribacter dokdonensis]